MKNKQGILVLTIISAIIILIFFCIFFTAHFRSSQTDADDAIELMTQALNGKTIVIDAGHGLNNIADYEKIAPDSDKTKPAYVSGTAGKNQTEEQLNLAISLLVESGLKEKGAAVYMTRYTHDADKSNIQRAEFANELNADAVVKIHADGSEDSTVNGISVLVPADGCLSDELCSKSESLGICILTAVVSQTGAESRGLSYRSDMTGFNWSKVPVVLIETGFMTNPKEDALLETEGYRQKIADGIVEGIIQYFADI